VGPFGTGSNVLPSGTEGQRILLPCYDINKVHRIAGARMGSIWLAASDACAVAGVLAEDIWLILEELHENDFCETRIENGRHVDVYCLHLQSSPTCFVRFFIFERDDVPALTITAFTPVL